MGITYETKLTQLNIDELVLKLEDSKCPLIMDANVYAIYKESFTRISKSSILTLSATTSTKTQETVNQIYSFLSEYNATRYTQVYVVGGGTIMDCAAFAVSTYKRGCRLILVPTTLLGMVDASIGGKTAINYNHKKNLIGSFYPAESVLIVPEFQSSLPEVEFSNGIAEMLKLWFIVPELELPVHSEEKMISPVQIIAYAKAKLAICSQDMFDNNQRRLLNLGHTFGHMLEALSSYEISHGTAVAWGMVIAGRMSRKLDLINEDVLHNIEVMLKQYGFTLQLDSKLREQFVTRFIDYITQDKKQSEKGITLVLFKDLRSVIIKENLPLDLVYKLLPACV
jgi:3-dehydroquinate synthase